MLKEAFSRGSRYVAVPRNMLTPYPKSMTHELWRIKETTLWDQRGDSFSQIWRRRPEVGARQTSSYVHATTPIIVVTMKQPLLSNSEDFKRTLSRIVIHRCYHCRDSIYSQIHYCYMYRHAEHAGDNKHSDQGGRRKQLGLPANERGRSKEPS